MEHPEAQARRQLALGTISFAACFAAWGLMSAFAPHFREAWRLNATQSALLVAVPVILGSLARIPVGLLSDRFGARRVLAALILLSALPAALIPFADSYRQLLALAFLLGLAGSTFAAGIGFVSRWFGPRQQGTVLGIYGLGNAGQSVVVFLGPLAAERWGWERVFYAVAVALVVWAAVFISFGREAPGPKAHRSWREMIEVLTRERLSWLLGAFYFLTFGGFVAFAIYLPSLLRDEFKLTPADAGLRTAGFVLLATAMRPVGGWLSDQIGGARVLTLVFFGISLFALLLGWAVMTPFTVGALGCAVLLGAGNGAVFKLVPLYFPRETATVTGLVGALGGLGGFFPPLLLGALRDWLGEVWPGFVLLSIASFGLGWINRRVFVARETTALPEGRAFEEIRAGAWATLWAGFLAAAIVVGSRNLEHFDPALVIYTFAVLFATWGIVYHYNIWLEKPPTRMFWDRGWELFWRNGPFRSLVFVARTAVTHLLGQGFIRRRSALRWWMHQLLFWGCVLAALVTFPLVFGWISFRSRLDDQMTYVVYLFGFPSAEFPVRSLLAAVAFHSLDIAAVLVLAGIALSLWRRMRDQGAQAVQSFAMDFMPLVILFSICVTGLALTVSQKWLRGEAYSFLAILHAITVVGGLLYLPFGKFFHIFQRPAQIGAKLYRRIGEEGPGALCPRCGIRFASQMHIEDLRAVLARLGYDYRMEAPGGHWQALCPACKRKVLAAAQARQKQEDYGKTPA